MALDVLVFPYMLRRCENPTSLLFQPDDNTTCVSAQKITDRSVLRSVMRGVSAVTSTAHYGVGVAVLVGVREIMTSLAGSPRTMMRPFRRPSALLAYPAAIV